MNKIARVKVRLKHYNPEFIRRFLDSLPKVSPPPYIPPKYNMGCPVCGAGADGEVMGYVCPRSDCPTRVTCSSFTVADTSEMWVMN